MTNKRGTRRSFGAIRQLPSGRYQVRYTGPDGAQHKPRRTFATYDDAAAWCAAERRLIDLDVWTPPAERAKETPRADPLTFGEYARLWIEQRKLKPTTRNLYRSQIETHILPTFDGLALDDIAPSDVRAWYAELERKPVRSVGKEHTGETRTARTYALLKTIFATAVEDGLIESNPARIKGASQVRRKLSIEVLTPAQLDALAGAMPEKYRVLVMLAAWAGLRRGEVLALRRRDIDDDGATIHVQRAVSFVRGVPTIGTTKSTAGARDVSVPPHIRSALAAHLAEHVKRGKDSLLFPGKDGGILDEWTLRYHFTTATDAAGLDDLRFHDLRHQGAVYAARAGATTRELMERLGHSTPAMSMRYQHAAAGRDAEIAERMSKMLENDSDFS